MCIIIYKVRSAVEWLQYGERCTIMTAPSAGVVSPSPELSMNWGRICLQDCSRWVIMPCTRHVLITPVLLTWPWTFLELHAPSPQPHRQRYGWVGLAHSNVNLNRTLILTPAANIITRTISINMILEYSRSLSWGRLFQIGMDEGGAASYGMSDYLSVYLFSIYLNIFMYLSIYVSVHLSMIGWNMYISPYDMTSYKTRIS